MTFIYSIKKQLLVIVLLLLVASISAQPNSIVQSLPTSISAQHSNGACWFFPISSDLDHSPIYDLQSFPSGNKSYCFLRADQTANLAAGQWKVIYIYPTKTATGYLKDISFDGTNLVSIFAKTKPINVAGKQTDMILEDLKFMLSNSTDGYEEYEVTLEPPKFTINRLEQVSPNIVRISGFTNMQHQSKILLKVDELEHYAKHDAIDFTFNTEVLHPDISTTGSWIKDMNLPLQNMSPGWHEVTATVNGMTTSARFPLYQTWEPFPTPTHYINYFGNGSIKPEIVTVEKIVTVIETREVIVQSARTPTPDITDALGEKVESRDIEIPTIVIILITIGLIFLVITNGRWK